jgi:hypothetical protein
VRITRRGHGADHGPSTLDLPQPTIRWEPENQCISFAKSGITDFSGNARHDYVVQLSLPELAEILGAVGTAPVEDCPETLSSALSPSLRALIRIVGVCVWPIRTATSAPNEGP